MSVFTFASVLTAQMKDPVVVEGSGKGIVDIKPFKDPVDSNKEWRRVEVVLRGVENPDKTATKEEKRWVSQTAELAYRSFEKSVLTEKFAKNLHEISGTLYELPQGIPSWKGVQALRAGVRLGEVKNGRFIPDHALAVALFAEQCKNKVSFPLGSEAVEKYLRGETVESEGAQNGWCLVCVEGYPLGWGKAVNGVIKNHYPKGLRKL